MNLQARLTRSANDKVIGGVCGGLAQYFGIDAVIVRLIFVALIFAGGMGILLYPILWLIMPVSTTGQPSLTNGLQEMQQVGQHVAGQVGEGAQALRAKVEAAFAGSNQPRFDPQTGLPLPQEPASLGQTVRLPHETGPGDLPATNRKRILALVLITVGGLILVEHISELIHVDATGIVVPLLLVGLGLYLLRGVRAQ